MQYFSSKNYASLRLNPGIMKKISLLSLFLFFIGASLFAQTEDLVLKSNSKGQYIEHKSAPKENFYSIGRLFGVHPKHIAAFNGLDMKKGLSIGQTVMIPLTDTNFSKKAGAGIPVYSENKTIAGYLIAGEIVQNGQPIQPKKEEVVVKKDTTLKIIPTDLEKTKNKGIEQNTTTDIVKEEKKPVIAEEPKKEQPKTETKKEPAPEDGYFKTDFEQQAKAFPLSKDETVTSGIFKVTRGGKDAKYYALMDGIEPGTIIKVVNPTNNKTVYAKVLGEMKGIRQNEGLDIRISDTAASALEISETDKFIVKLNY